MNKKILVLIILPVMLMFIIAGQAISGMAERFFIHIADNHSGSCIIQEYETNTFKRSFPVYYTVILTGQGSPSLNIRAANGYSFYNLEQLYKEVSKNKKGTSVRVEWKDVPFYGQVITKISGVDIIDLPDTFDYVLSVSFIVIPLLILTVFSLIIFRRN